MDNLKWAIFALGTLLCVSWLAFLVFGRRKPLSSEGGSQVLEYGGLKLGLGPSVWLMTLFALVAVLPLLIGLYTPVPQPLVCPEAPQTPPKPKDSTVAFHVSGTVLDCSGRVLEGARVVAKDGSGKKIYDEAVNNDGSYQFSSDLKLGDSTSSLTVTTSKDAYRQQKVTIFANALNFQPVLAAGGK